MNKLRHFPLLPGLAVIASLGLAACASAPPPEAQMAAGAGAISHAISAGAPDHAPAEIAMAQDKMKRSHDAVAAKDMTLAARLAEQAQVDAQVAEAKAESAKARKARGALQDSDQAMREEMARRRPPSLVVPTPPMPALPERK